MAQAAANSQKGVAPAATNNQKGGAQPSTKKVCGIQFLT
jgi:hypothetical protein